MHLVLSLALADPGGLIGPEDDAVRQPTYSFVHVADLPGRRRPDDVLARRRKVEAQLARAKGKRRAKLLHHSADLLLAASDAVWVSELRRLDTALATGETVDLETTDADALRDEALRRYETAIEEGVASPHAHLSAGLLRRERKELDAARAHLQEVLDGRAPRRVKRYAAVELGEMEFSAGEIDGALAAYSAAAELRGTDDLQAYTAYRMGWCALNLGEFEAATGHLLRAARTSDDRALAEEARGDAVRVAARLELPEALAVVDEVCNDASCVVDRREDLADALDANGRMGAAAEVRSLEP